MPTENAAIVIQSHFRRLIERQNFLKMLNAVSILQTAIRALLIVRSKPSCINFTAIQVLESSCGTFSFPLVHSYSLCRLTRMSC